MSSFVAFEPRRINLVERSRSSFAFVSISYVQVRIFFLLMMLMRIASGKSRPMRAECCTGTCRRRVAEEDIFLYSEESVLIMREIASAKHC
jgi:hypothetical protein